MRGRPARLPGGSPRNRNTSGGYSQYNSRAGPTCRLSFVKGRKGPADLSGRGSGRIEIDDPERQRGGSDILEPALSQDFHELGWRGECPDGRRQVGVRGVVPRHHSSDSGQHAVEVPEIAPRERTAYAGRRTREWRHRPPGLSTRAISSTAARVSSTLRMPNATVTASTDCEATGTRVASPRTSVTPRPAEDEASFCWPTRSMAPAKSTPTTRLAPGRASRAAIARSAVPVQRSTTRSLPGELQGSDRAAPPAAIDAGAQQVVEKIVSAGNGVEHAGDPFGRLRRVRRTRQSEATRTSRYRMPTYPFMSNARLTCDRSSARTSDCSYTSSAATVRTPA